LGRSVRADETGRQRFLQLESERQRDRFAGWGWYERGARKRRQYRNGYYERDFVTRFGTLRLRIARTREKVFCRADCSVFSGERKRFRC